MENTVRIATQGISEEMRSMKVGEVVRFPIDRYNYNSIRSTPSTSLVNDRLEGKKWKTRVNYDEKCVEVTRTA